jgi:hypothetical protein
VWLQIRSGEVEAYSGTYLPVRVFCLVDLGFDLGKEAVHGLGGGDSAFQGAALPECHNLLRGILETNPIGGAMGA